MKLQTFDGGISNRLAPQLLGLNQGIVYENIDNATGVLTPVKNKLVTDIQVQLYNVFFEAEDVWLSSDKATDYLEFQRVMYLTDRVSRPQKYSNGQFNNLGITRPATKGVSTNVSSATPLEDMTTLNNIDEGDLPAADFDYTLFNVKDGVYSTPFKLTVYASTTDSTRASGVVGDTAMASRYNRNTIITEAAPTNRSIQFKDLLGDLQDEARLYRYYDGAWRLLKIFADKSEEFLDDVYDISGNDELDEDNITSFNGTYQYVYTYYNSTDGTESAPSGISEELDVDSGNIQITLPSVSTDNQVTNKKLYRIGGNIAQFTLVETLANTVTTYVDTLSDTEIEGTLLESDNYYEAPTGLQYLTESYAMLFGTIGSELLFTPIGLPNAWPPEYSIQFDADITGLGSVSNGLLVFTRTKTFIVTGTGPTSLAQQSLRGDQGCIAFKSISEAFEGTLIWASEDGLCTSSGNNVTSLTKDNLGEVLLDPINSVVHDEIYYCQNTDGSILVFDYRFTPILKYLDLGTQTLTVAQGILYGYSDGLLYLLYKDTTNTTFKYKSPRFVEGSFSENKTYKKVYVRSEGDIILNIIIDDEIVATFTLNSTDTHQLQVPQNQQRGYSIQFVVQGTGTVHEIEYTVGPRQNG